MLGSIKTIVIIASSLFLIFSIGRFLSVELDKSNSSLAEHWLVGSTVFFSVLIGFQKINIKRW